MGKVPLKDGISVIICCYNSANVITPTILSIFDQNISGSFAAEIIIVDNGCTDNTIQIVEKLLSSSILPYKILKEPTPGLIHARKKGVYHAEYDITLFVDDDNLLTPNWFNILHECFKNKKSVGAIGGYVVPLIQGSKPDWFDDYWGVFACGPQNIPSGIVTKSRMMLVGAGLSFRTEILNNIFSLSIPLYLTGRTGNVFLRGEDAELCHRCVLLGWDLWFETELRLKHIINSKRLNWQHVIDVRRSGGAAEIVLHMYKNLIINKYPMSYSTRSATLCRDWKKHWKKIKHINLIAIEGSKTSFQHAYLTGMTEALNTLGKEEYEKIRKQLIQQFAIKYPPNKYYSKTEPRRDLIVTIADQNFVNQAKQLFASVYFNAGWEGDYMLLSSGISDRVLKWFTERGIIVNKSEPLMLDKASALGGRWPPAVLSKICLFQKGFKKWRTVIYLDADMIVRAPLDDLKMVKSLSAVQGLFSPTMTDRIKTHKHEISNKLYKSLIKRFSYFSRSFNGGIMAFNTDIIEENTFNEIIDMLIDFSGPLTKNEEAVLNFYFHKKWELLPTVYNVYVNSLKKPENAKGIVLHFVHWLEEAAEKPWNPESYFYNEWKDNLAKAEQIDVSKISVPAAAWKKSKVIKTSFFLSLNNKLFYFFHARRYSSGVRRFFANIKMMLPKTTK